jgi:hypothetical protein
MTKVAETRAFFLAAFTKYFCTVYRFGIPSREYQPVHSTHCALERGNTASFYATSLYTASFYQWSTRQQSRRDSSGLPLGSPPSAILGVPSGPQTEDREQLKKKKKHDNGNDDSAQHPSMTPRSSPGCCCVFLCSSFTIAAAILKDIHFQDHMDRFSSSCAKSPWILTLPGPPENGRGPK